MKFQVRVMPRAQDDVQQIIAWIKDRSLQGAENWYNAYQRMLERLAKQPLACGQAPEAVTLERELWQAMFKTRHGNLYRAIFLVEDSTVYLLRVRGFGQPPIERDEI
jgi:plasmid stabilization system protein ParE